MSGRKDKQGERDAASSFFGSDDDWLADEDSDLVPAAVNPGLAAAEAAPLADPAGVPTEVAEAEREPAAVPPEPESVGVVAEEAEAAEAAEAQPAEAHAEEAPGAPDAAEPEGGPPEDESQTPAAQPRTPVAPPPPPRFSGGPKGKLVKPALKGGFLDSILPRTLEPPPLATVAAPVRQGPETVNTIGGEEARQEGFVLAEGEEAWQEAVAVLELEAAASEEARGPLLLQSATVRAELLDDASGARGRLAQIGRVEGVRALRLAAALASQGPAAHAAWSALAEAVPGRPASEAWRSAAAEAATAAARVEDLQRAVAADPGDVIALEALLEEARRAGLGAVAGEAASGLARCLDPELALPVQLGLAWSLLEEDRVEAAEAAFRAVLELDPERVAGLAGLDAVLTRRGEGGERAVLLGEAAERWPEAAGPFHWVRASALEASGLEAEAALEAAALAGFGPAWARLEASLLSGDHPERLAALLDVAPSPSQSAWRLALVLERRSGDAALVRTLLERANAGGIPVARDALERAIARCGDKEALVAYLRAAIEGWDVPRPFDLVRLAEALEAIDPASEEARTHFAAAAEKGEIDGLRGLARVARAADEQRVLAEALERLSEREPDAGLCAARASEAGQVWTLLGDVDVAVRAFERAGGGDSGRSMAMEAAAAALVRAGRPRDAAQRLEAHAASLEGRACTPWWTAAARLRELDGDLDGALAAIEGLLSRVPDDEAAQRRVARLAGARQPDRLRARLLSEASPEAREAVDGLDFVLGEPIEDDAAVAVQALAAASDPQAFTAWLKRQAERGDVSARFAWGAATADTHGPEVLAMLEGPAGGVEVAWLRARAGLGAVDVQPVLVGALATAARQAGAAAFEERLTGLRSMAELSASAPVRAATAERMGLLLARLGRAGEALEAWRALLSEQPSSRVGFEGARDAAIALEDVGALRALWGEVGAEDARGLALALSKVEVAASADAWREAAIEGALLDRLGLEVALGASARWPELFEAWTERLGVTISADERGRIEQKRRWLLAEKLADTDLAWELYGQLHAEHPEDREITENLARIAGARGESDTALGFLGELAATAATPKDASRYHRRIAELRLGADDLEGARRALLDAVVVHPEDLESLRMLRQVAERMGDGEAVVDALQRESGLVGEVRRVEIQREIAQVASQRNQDPARAAEAWRAVLAARPGDLEALHGLLAAVEAAGDDGAFVEVGEQLVAVLQGAERSSLLRRLGLCCLEVGRPEEGVRFLEEAVDAEVPDLAAAVRLESVHRASNDHEALVRALIAQSGLVEDQAVAVEKLREAARRELDVRHDRDATHRIFGRLLELAPDDAEALAYEAGWLYERGRLPEALALHERIEALGREEDLDDPDVRIEQTLFYFRLAEMLKAEGRTAEARERYERALALNPGHMPTLEAVGPIHAAAGDWKRVGDVYGRLMQLTGGQGDPEQIANIYTMLGLVDLQERRGDKALKRFNRALDAFPNYVPALKGRARVHEESKDWQLALTAYNDVIYNATMPDDVTAAYITKGRILDEAMGRPDKAAQHYERSLAFEAEQPVAYLRLTEIALRGERWEEAIDTATRGLGFSQRAPEVAAELQLAIAIARVRSDDAEGAEAAVAAANVLDPEAATRFGEGLTNPEGAALALHARLPR